jgi:hypothetical protein
MRSRAVVAGVLLALAGCERYHWQNYRSPEGAYTVELPAKPRVENHTLKAKSGAETLTTATVEVSDAAFLSAWGDLPVGIRPDLQQQVADLARQYMGKVTLTQPNELAGSQGLSFTLETAKPQGQAAGRIWQVQNRMYLLLVLGRKVQPDDEEVKHFFESFQLVNPLMK